jgi:hypothetical protein
LTKAGPIAAMTITAAIAATNTSHNLSRMPTAARMIPAGSAAARAQPTSTGQSTRSSASLGYPLFGTAYRIALTEPAMNTPRLTSSHVIRPATGDHRDILSAAVAGFVGDARTTRV